MQVNFVAISNSHSRRVPEPVRPPRNVGPWKIKAAKDPPHRARTVGPVLQWPERWRMMRWFCPPDP